MQSRYYYRGTTRGWPGNPVLQEEKITCVTTDPVIATLFAVECRNHGAAAILIAAKAEFPTTEVPNFFVLEERAINLAIAPLEFEQRASKILDVETAISALNTLGMDQIPARFADRDAMFEEIKAYTSDKSLSSRQIHEFDRMIGLED